MKMMRRCLVVVALLLAVPMTARGEGRALELVKEIGVGWPLDSGHWMSFVAFNADGTMVASDGPSSPDDGRDNLTFWSFPDGRLIRHLAASPMALSPDWKHYASPQGVGEIATGRILIPFNKDEFPTAISVPIADTSPCHRRTWI